MLRRPPTRPAVALLAVFASLATSRVPEYDYRTPCSRGSVALSDWDPNRPLYLKWWGQEEIPINANLTDALVLETLDGEPVDFWVVSPGRTIVYICPKDGLEPGTTYEWRVRPFLNLHENHAPIPYYSQTGIVRFETASTSSLPPIGSAAQCRAFDDWTFETLPACTDGWFDADGDGWTLSDDCDDGDPTSNPGGSEVCDGRDNDCNGLVDDGFLLRVWEDVDGDGFGDAEAPVDLVECDPVIPSGTVANRADCDDADADVSPIATEIPGNGIDEDCDGTDAGAPDTAADTGSDTGLDTAPDTGAPDTGAVDTGSTGDTGAPGAAETGALPTGDTG